MKELSIEQKAKAYDEALNKASHIKDDSTVATPQEVAEYIFPELKESEDEKIRKHLIKHFGNKSKEDWNGVPVKSILAWLEKQGKKDVRYEILDQLLAADNIFQMAMNDAMVEEARNKAIKALQELTISKLLGFEKQGKQKPADGVVCFGHWKNDLRKAMKDG